MPEPIDRCRTPGSSPLADEQGPIPTFGPVRVDDRGRLLALSEAEWAARADAVRRTLAVLGAITDQTDTDEAWDEVERALRRGAS